jgi:hypothetical protein
VVSGIRTILLIGIISITVSCTREKYKPLTDTPLPDLVPINMRLHYDTIQQFGNFKAGDNWCQTWAADGNVYSMLDDGFGFNFSTKRYNNIPIRIAGGPDSITVTELNLGYPYYPFPGGWYGYGIISVDGILYTFISNSKTGSFGPFRGNKLFYSKDFGKTWYNHTGNFAEVEKGDTSVDKVFFWEEDPVKKDGLEGYAFSWISFCQNGKDNAHGEEIGDPYIYLYAPEPDESWKLNMARVKKINLRNKSAYEYFQGFNKENQPLWTNDINSRGISHEFPSSNAWGLYSWQPSIVWNEGFKCYIMVNYGTRFGSATGSLPDNYWNNYMHEQTGSIGFWYSKHPWGPWKQIYYDPYFAPGNTGDRTYQVKLSPKWIEDDGRTMYIVWSDARDKWTTNYLWNQMKVTILEGILPQPK